LKVISKDQCIKHAKFGIGVVKSSNESRTVIDFYEDGPRTFVTRMFEAELLADAPPRPGKAKASARKKKKATGASGK
jgi:hypothetical protein